MNELERIRKEAEDILIREKEGCFYNVTTEFLEQPKTILRLCKLAEKLIEQRDGYRDNYMSVMRVIDYDKLEIIRDNNKELQKILEGDVEK